MTDFKITVGMSIQSILQNLDNVPNLSDKIRQVIIVY